MICCENIFYEKIMFKKITGEVIHWKKLGRLLGFRTANMSYTKDDIDDCVYLVNIVINGEVFRWMWTYMLSKKIFETHIFNFSQDIYGETVEVIILQKIRDNRKFENLEDLKIQIHKDKIVCENIKMPVLTFWSFDLIHEWHKHYLFEAKKYGTYLSTVVASDENIKKIKGITTHYLLEERVKMLKNLGISDDVLSGSNINPMQWIASIKPSVVCLWYDQRWPFVDKLEDEIKNQSLDTKIIRINSHQPEIFKSSLLKKKAS